MDHPYSWSLVESQINAQMRGLIEHLHHNPPHDNLYLKRSSPHRVQALSRIKL